MRSVKKLFDLNFILSSVFVVPWSLINDITDSYEKIYELKSVDIEPRPLIGETKLTAIWRDVIYKHFDSSIGDQIGLTFIVYKNGKLGNIDSSMRDEKLAKKLSGILSSLDVKWLPGLYKGGLVNVRMEIALKL